jgi:uncharacterized protein YndB with AHSA1/START domain
VKERQMVRWIVYTVAAIVLLAIVVVATGYLLPVSHVATASATFAQQPAAVFAAIADVRRYPEWRSGVSRVDLLSASPRTRWRESGSSGDITFEVEEAAAPVRLRTRIVDPSLPFGGSWTYEVAPSGSGTTVRITERGEVYNPVFRVMSRFVFGHTATMEQFLRDLRDKLR